MSWLLLALRAPLLWSLSNLIDKFAIHHVTSGPIPFIFLLSAGNIIFAAGLLAYAPPTSMSPALIALNLASGLAIFCQYYLYSQAIGEVDISVAIPIHQSEPLFVLVGAALFLHTLPTNWQLAGFALVILGLLVLCFSRTMLAGMAEARHVWVLLASAMAGAVATLLSEQLLQHAPFTTVLALNFAGYAAGGFALLLNPRWRRLIIDELKRLTAREWGVFALTNACDVGGYALFTAALATGASAAPVSVIVSIHPVYVLLLSLLMARYFPQVLTENTSAASVARKAAAISVIVAGVAIIAAFE